LPITRLKVVEDAAQGVMATYKGKALGSIGDLGAYSFHETKNVTSVKVAVLLINRRQPWYQELRSFVTKAPIEAAFTVARSTITRGRMLGRQFLPGELAAAFLWAQLEEAGSITEKTARIVA